MGHLFLPIPLPGSLDTRAIIPPGVIVSEPISEEVEEEVIEPEPEPPPETDIQPYVVHSGIRPKSYQAKKN